jgi:hypothetical protein
VCLLSAQLVPGLPNAVLLGRPSPLFPVPLFDAERAIRDVLGENPPPGTVFEISLGSNLLALTRGEFPPKRDPGFEVPDFVPEEWAGPAGEEPAS